MLGEVGKDVKFGASPTLVRRILSKVKKISDIIFHLNASQRTLHKQEISCFHYDVFNCIWLKKKKTLKIV